MVRSSLAAAAIFLCSATSVGAQTWPVCFKDGAVLTPEGYRALREAREAYEHGPAWASTVTLYAQPGYDEADPAAKERLTIAYLEVIHAGFSPAIEILKPYESAEPRCVSISVRRLEAGRPPSLRTWHYYPVFFDSGSAVVDPKAMSALRVYAATYQPGMRVVLHGFTDTAGSPEVNLALSRRRIDAVTDAFIRLGVHARDVETTAYGETNLMRPTADGVSYWMNRRVGIDMRMQPR